MSERFLDAFRERGNGTKTIVDSVIRVSTS